MRALLFFAVLVVSIGNIHSQSINDLAVAREYYQNKDYDKAKSHIDLAVQFKKTSKKSETWLWRGKIYYSFATLSETPTTSADKVRFHRASAEAFKKALELDNKGEHTEKIHKTLRMMNSVFLNEGLINFNAKDYTNAVFYFELGTDVLNVLGETDTVAIYNAGIAYEKLNKVDHAVARYRVCADLNYGGPAVYDFMYTLLSISQRSEEANLALTEGLSKYPNDVSLIRSQMSVYVKADEGSKALDLIDGSIDSKPETAILDLMRGALKEKLKMETASIHEDYQQAIDLREDYFDANQKMGLFHYKLGMKHLKASCDINDAAQAEPQKALGQAELERAMPYLEKARALKSYDRKTLETLKKLYSQLDLTAKHQQVGILLKN